MAGKTPENIVSDLNIAAAFHPPYSAIFGYLKNIFLKSYSGFCRGLN